MRTKRYHLRLGGTHERLRMGKYLMIFWPLFAIIALLNLSLGPLDSGRLFRCVFWTYHCGVLSYAIIYPICAFCVRCMRRCGHRKEAYNISTIPLIYFATLVVLGVLLVTIEGVPAPLKLEQLEWKPWAG
jgi:hypothetical protein